MISEISGDGADVEFTNAPTGTEELDLSGWMRRSRYFPDSPTGQESRRIEGGTLLKPGRVFTWSSRTNVVDRFPTLRRIRDLSMQLVGRIELYDPSGTLVDEVRFVDEAPAPGRLWNGLAVNIRPVNPLSLQRRGSRNHFAGTDWIPAPPTSVGPMRTYCCPGPDLPRHFPSTLRLPR